MMKLPAYPPFEGHASKPWFRLSSRPPSFTIRRKASAVFTLGEYERQGIMSPRSATP